MSQTHYQTLNVSHFASTQQIQHQYEAYAIMYRDEPFDPTFQAIEEAYTVLSDPVSRALYDMQLRDRGYYQGHANLGSSDDGIPDDERYPSSAPDTYYSATFQEDMYVPQISEWTLGYNGWATTATCSHGFSFVIPAALTGLTLVELLSLHREMFVDECGVCG